ncbi:MAG: cache domain-containing protein [Selenomonadaceae bacterium]|nr:cache domain-containing protein [Selenomonadaceae bacterium]
MNKIKDKRAMSGEEKRAAIKTILLSATVITFFVAIILSYYNMLYNNTRDNIIKDGQTAAMQSTAYLDEYLSIAIHAVELTSYTLDDMIKNNRTNGEILEYLKWQSTAVSSTVFENFTGIYGYINDSFIDSIGWAPDPGEYFVATERPWYVAPMANNGKLTIVDPYLDAQTKTINMAVGKRLADGKSVIAIDIALDRIQKIIEKTVESGKVDYVAIMDSNDKVAAHSDKQQKYFAH